MALVRSPRPALALSTLLVVAACQSAPPAQSAREVVVPAAPPRPPAEAPIAVASEGPKGGGEGIAEQDSPPRGVNTGLAEQNVPPNPPEVGAAEETKDTTIYRVPIDGSPVRGKPTALVTMVMFGGFQCPFCGQIAPTIEGLSARYGDRLRVVYKNRLMAFHPNAEPAAQLALEAKAQKGDEGFWRAHDLLFRSQRDLSGQALEGYAQTLGLNVAAVRKAIASHKHARRIEADEDLAERLGANGTPTFFINGRKLMGAQSPEKFERLIDEQLTAAQRLVAAGTPRAKVYDTLQKGAKDGPGFEKKALPPAGKDVPSAGARPNAPIVVTVFTDYQCAPCRRADEAVDALAAAFPGKVRVVVRQLPQPGHAEAPLAAEASIEAFRQKGEAGFVQMKQELWDDPSALGLSRGALELKATRIGLDLGQFNAALDAHAHRAEVERDAKIAESVGIRTAPAVVINNHLVGAPQLGRLKSVARRMLTGK